MDILKNSRQEIKALTGLRGIAALWVMGYHINANMPAPIIPPAFFGRGTIGVDVFFVLSGFILMRTHRNMLVFEWPSFFIKRVFRIYPLHLTVMCLLALKAFVSPPTGQAAQYYDWKIFPYVLSLTATAFGLDSNHWNASVWSLTIELVCYIIFPLTVLVVAQRKLPVWLSTIILLLIVCFGIKCFMARWDLGLAEAVDGVQAFERGIAGFFSGSILYLVWEKVDLSFKGFDVLAAILFLVFTYSSAAFLSPITIVVLIAALAYDKGPVAQFLGSWPVWKVGEISLSVYLLHAPLLHIIEHFKPILAQHMNENLAASSTVVLMFGCVIVMSAVTYRWIERPGQKCGRFIINRLPPPPAFSS